MAANRRRDTSLELHLRSLLHARGLRFRVDYPIPVPGRRPVRPDIVFTRARVVVFVDGCYWHGCPEHWSPPKSNVEYWTTKIERNQERDRQADAALAGIGWSVVRLWEHEDMERAAAAIEATVRAKRQERSGG
ncbi:MAG TPA: very short patch repair endonuclease [Solirubrobacterales bacterium]|nr:very short patch repair endonuclease [Solirubrobacterales bacterium]